jgi:hypothetical protein
VYYITKLFGDNPCPFAVKKVLFESQKIAIFSGHTKSGNIVANSFTPIGATHSIARATESEAILVCAERCISDLDPIQLQELRKCL